MQYRRSDAAVFNFLPSLSALAQLWRRGQSNARAMLRRADLGITHFDLANNYGPPLRISRGKISARSEEDFFPIVTN
jgi:aryl-alcohol dehydrogenase-like predicted oxidoreductase